MSMAMGTEGWMYVTGETTTSGGGYSGGQDMFLTKYYGDATPVWTRKYGSELDEIGRSVAVGPGDEVVVVGTAQPGPDLDDPGYLDIFIRKYTSEGEPIWTEHLGTDETDVPYSVAVDAEGNIIVAGATTGTMGDAANQGQEDAFLAKFDAAGAQLWIEQFGTPTPDVGYGVAVDPEGHILLTGHTAGELVIDGAQGREDAYLARYTSGGDLLWLRQWGAAERDGGNAVSVDANGDVYVVGSQELDDITIEDDRPRYVSVVKHDDSGEMLWLEEFDVGFTASGMGLDFDDEGNVHIVGLAMLDGDQWSATDEDAFVAKMTPEGDLLWDVVFGGWSYDWGLSIALTETNQIYAMGGTWGPVDGEPVESESLDTFLALICEPE